MTRSNRSPRQGRGGIPLRLLVTAPFLLLLAGTVGLTGWLLILNGLRAADEITAELSREVGRRVEDYLVRYLEEAHLVNDLNADAVLQGELSDWGSDALGRHFWYQLQRFENLSFVFLGTRHGGAAGAGRVGERVVVDTTDVDPTLGLVAGVRREYLALEGGGRGEALQATDGFDATRRPWFTRAVEKGGPVWSEVYRFARDETVLAIAASRPVYEPGGELWGVLGVDLELGEIGGFLASIADPGEVSVFESDGSLIATSVPLVGRDGERRLAWETGNDAMDEAARLGFRRIAELESDGHWPESTPAGAGDPTSLAMDVEGMRYLVQVDGHTDPRGLDWRIVTMVPQERFLAGITPATRSTVAICAAALLLAMIGGFLLSRWISRPVEQLTLATRAMAEGEWQSAVPGGRIRELSDLSSSFNQMAGELKEAFAVLEDRVAERTAELETATANAVAANQAKTEFLATVSHEVRTPLSTILGYVDLLRDHSDDPERVDRHLRTIRDSGTHLNQLVGDLLDVGRIEAGRLELDPVPCALGELLAQLRSMFSARAAERRLELLVETEAELPWRFVADAVRIRQILSNLLSNAIRYTETGTVRLVVSTESRDDDESSADLALSVIDTGVGIPLEDQDRIFDRFTQVEGGLRGGQGVGFGLGLWITRQLAERMGGRIEFTSEPGVGSTFVAFLPVDQCSDWGVRQVEASAIPDPVAEPRLSGKVLVAEDSLGLRDLCRHRLEQWGVACQVAEDGREAIARAASEPFDLILMDWQMPYVDGLEATRALRRREVNTPIIALTAAAMPGDRERCLAAGCDRYLVKPINFRELYRVLTDFLPTAKGAGRDGEEGRSDGGSGASTLADLSARYVGRLPDRVREIGAALDQLDFERAVALAHRLAGTAGSYGLDDVSRCSASVEEAARANRYATASEAFAQLEELVEGYSNEQARVSRRGAE